MAWDVSISALDGLPKNLVNDPNAAVRDWWTTQLRAKLDELSKWLYWPKKRSPTGKEHPLDLALFVRLAENAGVRAIGLNVNSLGGNTMTTTMPRLQQQTERC